MATIQQRKASDGSISYRAQIRIQGLPPQSKTFARKTDARIWASQCEAALREQRNFPTKAAERHTIAELVDRNLDVVARRRPHALLKQRQLLTWWKERIGRYALVHVTPALIVSERDRLRSENVGTEASPRHRSPATANRYLAALSRAFTFAVREWHWIHDNPLRRVSKEPEAPGRVRFLSTDERARLLVACRSSSMRELELIVMLALTTGMRRGEILGLRWGDLDRARGLIVLHKTKNRERRSVPIDSAVRPLLDRHASVRRLDTDLVFPHPIDQAKALPIDDAFQEVLATAEIGDFRFHDLRHTAASYLAMSGATTAEIAAVLGHKTLQMVKRYAHLSDQHTGQVVRRMTEKFFAGG